VSLVESAAELEVRGEFKGGKPWFLHSSDWFEDVLSIERMSMLEGSDLSLETGVWEDSLKRFLLPPGEAAT